MSMNVAQLVSGNIVAAINVVADDYVLADDEVVATGSVYVGGDLVDGYFYPPQPFPSWTREEGNWLPPTPMPEGDGRWYWDEPTLSWVALTDPA